MIRGIHYFGTELKTKINVIPRGCFNYYHYYRFNVTFLSRTITSHLSLYYPYYHAFMI